jgi:hypothetical protein
VMRQGRHGPVEQQRTASHAGIDPLARGSGRWGASQASDGDLAAPLLAAMWLVVPPMARADSASRCATTPTECRCTVNAAELSKDNLAIKATRRAVPVRSLPRLAPPPAPMNHTSSALTAFPRTREALCLAGQSRRASRWPRRPGQGLATLLTQRVAKEHVVV